MKSKFIRFISRSAHCIVLTLSLSLPIFNLQAQQQVAYFDFTAAGTNSGPIKTFHQKKLVRVLTVGGYVNIRATKALRIKEGIGFRAYFISKKEEKIIENPFNGPIYLFPGTEFFIDLFEINTNRILIRYILQRPLLYPKIDCYKEDNHHFLTSKTDGGNGEFSLSPNEKIRIEFIQPNDFEGMEVEYSLQNLRTKRSQQGVNKYNIKDLNFEENTDYVLRLNYTNQKESTAVIYIHVKPYWYQSPITYVSFLIILMAMGVLLLARSFKKRINISRKEQQNLEQAAIRLQSLLNPHFTFNALSSIQGLMNTNRIDEANQYLEEFSALLRKTLAASKQVYTTLDQELEMMRLYIKLEAFRFNFSWEIELSADLNPSTIEIPTLLLQPLIENAIKHGIGNLADRGKLLIKCKTGDKKDTYVIVIKDNGTWVNNVVSKGYGISLTEERIHTINKMKKEQNIVLRFNKDNGTEAILTFHNSL
ncbi:histidine kinase [Pedobacter sp. Du54]|uniref:sensor histidine kinase n=1 Tax=Pedobacter anseongensis TaxID=3133439 RepID=UPI0030B45881